MSAASAVEPQTRRKSEIADLSGKKPAPSIVQFKPQNFETSKTSLRQELKPLKVTTSSSIGDSRRYSNGTSIGPMET